MTNINCTITINVAAIVRWALAFVAFLLVLGINTGYIPLPASAGKAEAIRVLPKKTPEIQKAGGAICQHNTLCAKIIVALVGAVFDDDSSPTNQPDMGAPKSSTGGQRTAATRP